MTSIEAVVLTGGKSRRMGRDKAKLKIEGVPQAERVVRQLLTAGIPVTVLGREPIDGANFLQDATEYAGPLAALARFQPSRDMIFVASCDLPSFNAEIVSFLSKRICDNDACAPEVDGFRQPLCALYRREAFKKLEAIEDKHCVMGWLDELKAVIVPEREIVAAGLKPAIARGANTPEELAAALAGS